MHAGPLCSSVFMSVSESRMEVLRWSGSEEDSWYVQRLFEQPRRYDRWESFHFRIIKSVAAIPRQRGQTLALRRTRFSLIQRQALFQHIREHRIVGTAREILIRAFHTSDDIAGTIIAEHGRFLRTNSSLLCTDYLGTTLLGDARFNAELDRYRDGYMEYFALHCDWILADVGGFGFPLRPLLAQMKHRLTRMQLTLETMPVAEDRRKKQRSLWRH